MRRVRRLNEYMDSIELLQLTAGKQGNPCKVSVKNFDTYDGIYRGFCESTFESPLSLRLQISETEAHRIGVPWLKEIGIPYDIIRHVEF